LQRRAAYMQGLVDSLRLPSVPAPAASCETSDGVLLRLLELRKGRGLLARILRLLTPPQVPSCAHKSVSRTTNSLLMLQDTLQHRCCQLTSKRTPPSTC